MTAFPIGPRDSRSDEPTDSPPSTVLLRVREPAVSRPRVLPQAQGPAASRQKAQLLELEPAVFPLRVREPAASQPKVLLPEQASFLRQGQPLESGPAAFRP
jgi:hypothetical protein